MEDDIEVQETALADDDPMRAFLPAAFGKRRRSADVAAQIDRTKRLTEKEQAQAQQSKKNGHHSGEAVEDQGEEGEARVEDGEEDDDPDSDSDSDSEIEFPTTHEILLKTHERAVTSISLDASGGRLVTASTDATLKFHDFASMTPTTLRAFKSVDPTGSKTAESHTVHHVIFNPLAASQMLVIPATPQAKVMSRDGEPIVEFIKGDMYLRDMHNTKGHVSEITAGAWHPTERTQCVTAGTDSTLRIWDVSRPRAQKHIIVHKSRAAGSGGRTRMTAVAWASPVQGGSNFLVAAALDGSLAMWSGDGPYTRPTAEIRDGHVPDTWTGGLDVSPDGRLIVTRGGDDTIKLWDSRKFKSAVATLSHASTSSQYPTTNIRFSPSGANIITGSSTGHLHILNPARLQAELVTPVTPNSALVSVCWHDKLNQIITGSANAETHVLYNPTISSKGAALIMSKAPKRRHIDDDPSLTTDVSQGISGDAIVNPNGVLAGSNQTAGSFAARHPTIGLTASGRSRDPRRPHLPATTPFAKTQPDEKHIKDHIPLSSMRDEDPREALLKFAEKAEKEPMFTNAWRETQPKTIYAELSDDDEAEGPDQKKARR